MGHIPYKKTPVESCAERLFDIFSDFLNNSWFKTYYQFETASKKIHNGVPPHLVIEEEWIKGLDREVVIEALKSVKDRLDNSPF
jgi:hypothetical protein